VGRFTSTTFLREFWPHVLLPTLRYLGLPFSVRCKKVDFQHLEDKCAGKLPTWNGKYVTMAGLTTLVKSAIASQAIYHLTPLNIPPETVK
jgi:hypothetical protein